MRRRLILTGSTLRPRDHAFKTMVADELRSKGRTLAGYAILGPVPADAPRCFAVKLTLGNPRAEVRERVFDELDRWLTAYVDGPR